jgi:hypothetical protein
MAPVSLLRGGGMMGSELIENGCTKKSWKPFRSTSLPTIMYVCRIGALQTMALVVERTSQQFVCCVERLVADLVLTIPDPHSFQWAWARGKIDTRRWFASRELYSQRSLSPDPRFFLPIPLPPPSPIPTPPLGSPLVAFRFAPLAGPKGVHRQFNSTDGIYTNLYTIGCNTGN